VQQKRIKYFVYKCKYLGHIKSLKKKGSNIVVMTYINTWLEDNIDDIYKKFHKSEFSKSNIKLSLRIQKNSEAVTEHSKQQLKALLLDAA
jgi:tryptophan synthase alpha subunit